MSLIEFGASTAFAALSGDKAKDGKSSKGKLASCELLDGRAVVATKKTVIKVAKKYIRESE